MVTKRAEITSRDHWEGDDPARNALDLGTTLSPGMEAHGDGGRGGGVPLGKRPPCFARFMQAHARTHTRHNVNCVWRQQCRPVPSNCPFASGAKKGRESRGSLGGKGGQAIVAGLCGVLASLPRCVCVPPSHTVVPHGGRMRREHCDGQQRHREVSTHIHTHTHAHEGPDRSIFGKDGCPMILGLVLLGGDCPCFKTEACLV